MSKPSHMIVADEHAAASGRFRRSNAEARAAGCKCGLPATHVRRLVTGFHGSVAPEMWSCAEHVDVGRWTRVPGGAHWKPVGEYDAATLAYMTPATEATR